MARVLSRHIRRAGGWMNPTSPAASQCFKGDDDDVYYYIRWRLELEGETENTGVCTKERKGVTAAVLMATPCTNSRVVPPK